MIKENPYFFKDILLVLNCFERFEMQKITKSMPARRAVEMIWIWRFGHKHKSCVPRHDKNILLGWLWQRKSAQMIWIWHIWTQTQKLCTEQKMQNIRMAAK